MMIFIHSGSEIYEFAGFPVVPSCMWYIARQRKSLVKNVSICFDGDEENILLSILMYLQIAGTYVYNDYPKLKSIFGFWSHRQTCFESSHNSKITR